MNRSSVTVSVVVATYNRKHCLKGCIESILGQTSKSIEIIVVDDGSSDDTKAWIEEEYALDPRIRYIFLDGNSGSSSARNRGVAEASGEFVMVWDSDDRLFPHALDTLLKVFSQDPSCVVVSSPAVLKRGDEIIEYPERSEGIVPFDKILCRYLPHNEKVRLVRRFAMKKAPYVSKNIDFIVGVRLAAQGPWFHVNEPLGEVEVDMPDSLTRKRRSFDPVRSVDRSVHLLSFLQEFGETMKENCPEYYASHAYGASLGLFLSGDIKNARYYAREAVKYGPIRTRRVIAFMLPYIPFPSFIRRLFFKQKLL